MTALSTNTLSADLAEQLSQAIIRGELAQGSKLSEPELARHYGVSRGPLREAIMRLQGLGLVTRQANLGARVITLTPKSAAETFAVREALEGMAARLACSAATDEELAALQRLIAEHEDELRHSHPEHYADQEGNYDFHLHIIRASHNRQLMTLLGEELYARIRMFRQHTADHRGDPWQALQEHKMIVDALCHREADLAEILMRRHISRSRTLIESYLQAQSLHLSHPARTPRRVKPS
jgi:DNA-binding GntR family transcriptional regulator